MLKQIAGLLLVFVILLFLTGCPYGHKYEEGHFPQDPVNFEDVNSEFDDYNSTAPSIESERYLYFSSNRNSSGGEFDIVGSNFRIYFDKDDGKLTVDDRPHSWRDFNYTDSLFDLMNTSSDEFGPYSLPYQIYSAYPYSFIDMIVFSNNESGNQDLKLVWFKGSEENPETIEGIYNGPKAISFLNTDHDDAYLTFYGPGFMINDYWAWDRTLINELLFCSNRSGNFDIFRGPVQIESTLIDFLSGDDGPAVTPVDILNSNADDKCPFVNGEMLVFSSNRPGGYGGFDLYYAQRDGDTWMEPVNFGTRINTEYDEYRPIIISHYEFVNDMMLFSSNRPGGKGGYDLYYVGISKMIY